MPKNINGGKKAKSQKNSNTGVKYRDIEVPIEEYDSHVAIITKVLGDGRFHIQVVNSEGTIPETYIANLSTGTKNKYSKGIILSVGTYVLITFRSFQKSKADILFIYRDSEIDYLKNNNYITIDKVNNATDDIEFLDFKPIESNTIDFTSI